jgi:hypothetical protein
MLVSTSKFTLVVVNTVTNRVARLLGKDETVRWMNLSLYQGAPAKHGRSTTVHFNILNVKS